MVKNLLYVYQYQINDKIILIFSKYLFVVFINYIFTSFFTVILAILKI